MIPVVTGIKLILEPVGPPLWSEPWARRERRNCNGSSWSAALAHLPRRIASFHMLSMPGRLRRCVTAARFPNAI